LRHRNIWILNHYAHGPDLPGGTRHYNLATMLAERGHDVTILASNWNHSLRRQVRLENDRAWSVEEMNAVRFVWLRTFPCQLNDWRRILNMLSYSLRAFFVGRRLARVVPGMDRPDIVLGSSVHLFAVLAAYWLARHYGAHFVMEVRDLWPQTLVDMGLLRENHPLTWFLRYLERFLYRRADRIVTVLPLARDYITRLGIPPDKIDWIPNGVDLSLYQHSQSPRPRDHEETFVLMYAGAHGAANGLDTLLEAASILERTGRQDIRCVLLGDGPEKVTLMRMKDRLGLTNVEFRDPVPKEQLQASLSDADAFVLTLQDIPVFRYGISPNKLFDYLAACRPIVLAVDASNNIVDEAGCGVSVPPADPRALAKAISELASLPPEARWEMARNGRVYVERNHDFRLLARRFEEIMESL
jgi:glycosyltransferase involved in cell wall biosynthesis